MSFFFEPVVITDDNLQEIAESIRQAFTDEQLTIQVVDNRGDKAVIENINLIEVVAVPKQETTAGRFYLTIFTSRGNFTFEAAEVPSITWLGDYTADIQKQQWLTEGPPRITIAARTVI